MATPREQSTDWSVISLFSGAMGLDLGLEDAGFSVRVAVEINRAAIDTIRLNRPTLPILSRSLAQLTTQEILTAANLSVGEATLVSGGPCCQSFSTAGRRASLADPRGSLFFDFCRVIREAQPRFFVMENVRGILSAAVRHRPLNKRGPGYQPLHKDERFGSALRRILKEFQALHYHVVFGLLNCADYGVPQKRWRVVFIGSRDGELVALPQATHRDPSETGALPEWVNLRDALEGVRAKHWIPFRPDRKELLERVPPGENWRALPKKLHRKALGAAIKSWGGRTGFCRRLAWEEPAPTLTTAPDGRATTLCHPSKSRTLSVEEYASLQQFPKKWRFAGTLRQQYEQIGNAVPLGLGRAVGESLRRLLERQRRLNKRLRGTAVCDPRLQKSLARQKVTKLNPSRMRRYRSADTAHKWLVASAL
jgi:DNA (cytosine-5)-methyltransferase 1